MATKKATNKTKRQHAADPVRKKTVVAVEKKSKSKDSPVKKVNTDHKKLCNLKIPPAVHVQLTTYGNRKNETMIEVCGEALDWFIRKHANKPFMMYLAHFPKHKLIQFWIPEPAYSNAVMVSKRDGVPVARVIYTAMMLFCDSEVTGDRLFTFS
jgi:hypothetical protein